MRESKTHGLGVFRRVTQSCAVTQVRFFNEYWSTELGLSKQQVWRENIKQDPVRYAEHLEAERLRAALNRLRAKKAKLKAQRAAEQEAEQEVAREQRRGSLRSKPTGTASFSAEPIVSEPLRRSTRAVGRRPASSPAAEAVRAARAAERLRSLAVEERASALGITLPLGHTPGVEARVFQNPGGLQARFGIDVNPGSTWLVGDSAMKGSEQHWIALGLDDSGRPTEATLGALHSFDDYYGKGSSQKYSDFKPSLAASVYNVFPLTENDGAWLDFSFGGGMRQLVAAHVGMRAVGFDLRADCVAAAEQMVADLELSDLASFAIGDMRTVVENVARWRELNPDRAGWKFRGCFTSPPFWRLERYDSGHTIASMAEHCKTWESFVGLLRQTVEGVIEVLEPNSWIIIHCGPQRIDGDRCDMEFELKLIMRNLRDLNVRPYCISQFALGRFVDIDVLLGY